MVTSCATCPNKPIECVYCTGSGTHPGVCGPQNQLCNSSAPMGAGPCTCNGSAGGNVAACPAPFQVCGFVLGQYYCQTCGEMMTATDQCKDGKYCSVSGTCM
jgi:hypothetical protein